MLKRDTRDILAGLLLLVMGVVAAVYSLSYQMGSLRQAGPGLFPLILAALLIFLSLFVLVPALLRAGPAVPEFHLAQFSAVIGAIVLFGVTIQTFGMVPAVFLLVMAASAADERISPVQKAALAGTLTAIAAAVFYYGLGLQFELIAWPF
jgi:hypothetical protein